jgi:8-oxo-dGTP pyrophosphatase MutT (NUDIX family)
MKFEEVIRKLELILREPLPGRIGQLSMSPLPVDEKRFAEIIRPDSKKGAVLMLFYPDGNDCYVPCIKRQSYIGVHSGQISLPGGKMDPIDIDLRDTALRESEEEIGIDRNQVTILGRLSDLYIPPSNFLVAPFLGYINKKPQFLPDPYEVEKIIHCTVPFLLDKKNEKKGLIPISTGQNIQAPYIDIQSEMVWGATAMILGEFKYLWENSLKN